MAQDRSVHPGLRVGIRVGLIAALTVVAYWSTFSAVVDEFRARTLITYLPVVLVLIVIAAVGVTWRRGNELPIHDSQTDVIVGTVVVVLAVFFQLMLNPRYAAVYLTLHMDLLSVWLFVLGCSILVFGLRPTARYRWVWVLALAIFPLPYRMVVLSMGTSTLASAVVTLAIAVVATAIAVGRTRRLAMLGSLLCAAIGGVTIGVLLVVDPAGTRMTYQLIPSLVASVVVGAVMYLNRRRETRTWNPLGRRVLPLVAVNVVRSGTMLAVLAAGLHFVPVPYFDRGPEVAVNGLAVGEPLAIPAGLRQTDQTVYRWVTRLYGPGARLTRQELMQQEGDARFDKSARPRKIVADTIVTSVPVSLDVYPVVVVYNLVKDRFSPTQDIALHHGLNGWLLSIVDDERLLTYNRLSWWWTDGRRTQFVSLLAVDDHSPGAVFPTPALTIMGNVNSLLTVLIRGNAVVQDDQPVYKDRQLLVETANQLIDRQLAVSGRGTTG